MAYSLMAAWFVDPSKGYPKFISTPLGWIREHCIACVGAHAIMVCEPGLDDTQVMRAFGTYTADLYTLANR